MLRRVSSWMGPKPGLLQWSNLFVQTLQYAYTHTWYKLALGKVGRRCVIMGARFYGDGKAIELDPGVSVRWGTRIEAVSRFAGEDLSPRLIIGENTNIEQNCHIVCGERIYIGRNVSITAGSSIVDIVHPYDTTEEKIGSAPIWTNPVEIGDGSFLGVNTVVLPGTKIGKRVVIGANSVVQGVLPDYTIWAGNPARCVMAYGRSKPA